jgi:mono/diheme cytochrome c family protein
MRTALAIIATVIVVAVLAGAAFVYSGNYYVGADQQHWPTTEWLLNEARNRSIRAHAAGITEPIGLNDPAKIVAGVSHYSEHCAVCHGALGVERGDLAEGLYPRPPNLTHSIKLYTPAELFWIIKHGIKMTGMPSWGDHIDDELWTTVAFVRMLPGMTPEEYSKLVQEVMQASGHHIGDDPKTKGAPADPGDHSSSPEKSSPHRY